MFSIMKSSLPYSLLLHFHIQLASILCVHEAPDLRPPLLTGLRPQIPEDGRLCPKRPKALLYSSDKIVIDSLFARVTSGSLRGTNTGKGSGLDPTNFYAVS